MKPRCPRALSTRSTTWARRLGELSSRGVCRAKMVERICRMVVSSSSMALCSREEASGRSTSRTVLIRVIATANSRWMTTSCRSLAMRSRSSSTPSRSASLRASASSSATAACPANACSVRSSDRLNGIRPARLTRASTPRAVPAAPSGTAAVGPTDGLSAQTRRTWSWSRSSNARGSPLRNARPASEPWTATSSSASRAPGPSSIGPTSRSTSRALSGSRIATASASAISRARRAIRVRTSCGSPPDSSRVVMSEDACSQVPRCDAAPSPGPGRCRSTRPPPAARAPDPGWPAPPPDGSAVRPEDRPDACWDQRSGLPSPSWCEVSHRGHAGAHPRERGWAPEPVVRSGLVYLRIGKRRTRGVAAQILPSPKVVPAPPRARPARTMA